MFKLVIGSYSSTVNRHYWSTKTATTLLARRIRLHLRTRSQRLASLRTSTRMMLTASSLSNPVPTCQATQAGSHATASATSGRCHCAHSTNPSQALQAPQHTAHALVRDSSRNLQIQHGIPSTAHTYRPRTLGIRLLLFGPGL